MNKQSDILNDGRFKRNHLSVPEGYFEGFPGRMMERIQREEAIKVLPRRHFSNPHWVTWTSAAAAILLVAWLGIRTFLPNNGQSDYLADKVQFMVEYYGDDLNVSILAGYLEDEDIQLTSNGSEETENLIFYHPDQAESLIYESLMH